MTNKSRSGGGAALPHNAASGSDPIAASLQRLFAPLAAEPIPDEFLALLDQIDANARANDAAKSSSDSSAGQ